MHRATHRLCSLTLGLLILSTVAIQRLPSCNIRADTNSTEEHRKHNYEHTQPQEQTKMLKLLMTAFFFWPICKKRYMLYKCATLLNWVVHRGQSVKSAATVAADLSPTAYMRSTPKPCCYTDHLHVAPTQETSVHSGLKKMKS